jgi:hypothetical protein
MRINSIVSWQWFIEKIRFDKEITMPILHYVKSHWKWISELANIKAEGAFE